MNLQHDNDIHRPWAGIISCHNKHGWFPAASFVDSRGECGVSKEIIATDIGYIKNEIRIIKGSFSIIFLFCKVITLYFMND